MKYMKLKIGLIVMVCIVIMMGCSKTEENKIEKKITKNKVTASTIMTKVVDKYKEEGLTDIRLTTTSAIGVDKNKKINIVAVFHNYFVNKDMKKCITNLNMKINVDKTTNHINMFMNENGNIAYAINNKTFYSADEMYTMLGIRYVAPEMEKLDIKSTDNAQPTATVDIYNIDGTLEPTEEVNMFGESEDNDDQDEEDDEEKENEDEPQATPTPRKIYTLDHFGKLGNKLIIKGNKEVDGRDCYVLKGQIQGIEIRNVLVTYLETNIYSIPKNIGNVTYEIYVDKASYEVKGLEFNLEELLKKYTGREEISDSKLEFKIEYNTGKILKFPVTKDFSVDCYGNVLNVFESVGNGFENLKK